MICLMQPLIASFLDKSFKFCYYTVKVYYTIYEPSFKQNNIDLYTIFCFTNDILTLIRVSLFWAVSTIY